MLSEAGASTASAAAHSISRSTRPHAQRMTARLHDAQWRIGHPRRQTEIIGEIAIWPILPILVTMFGCPTTVSQRRPRERRGAAWSSAPRPWAAPRVLARPQSRPGRWIVLEGQAKAYQKGRSPTVQNCTSQAKVRDEACLLISGQTDDNDIPPFLDRTA